MRAELVDVEDGRHVVVFDDDGEQVATIAPDAALRLAADLLDAVATDRLAAQELPR